MRKKFLFCLLFLLILYSGCKKQDPVVAAQPKVIVIISGGLGSDQTTDIFVSVKNRCPNATVVSCGSWNGYQNLTDEFIVTYKQSDVRIAVIAHSFAGDAISHLQTHLNYACLIDPVATSGDHLTLPDTQDYDLYKRQSWFGPVGAKYPDGTIIQVITGDHNSLPHNQIIIDEIITKINHL